MGKRKHAPSAVTACYYEGCFAPLEPVRLALGKGTCCRCSAKGRWKRNEKRLAGKPRRAIQPCLYCGLSGHSWYQCANVPTVERAKRLAEDVKRVGWIHIRRNPMHFRVYYIPEVWCAEDCIEVSWIGAKRVPLLK